MRQLPSEVLTGCAAQISGSFGPKHVGVLEPSLQTQDGAATVYRAALYFRIQRIVAHRMGSRPTVPFRNQHDPSLLGYLVLETPQRPWNIWPAFVIHLDTFSFLPPDTQRPLF